MRDIIEKVLDWLKRVAAWFAPPVRLCTTAIALAFIFSFIGWLCSPFFNAVLFFPKGNGIVGEIRALPKTGGTEARAELIASEVLLGPISPNLRMAFPTGVKLRSALCRGGTAYIDLSENAALAGSEQLKPGLEALRRSLRAGLPFIFNVRITIGGHELSAYAAPKAAAPRGK